MSELIVINRYTYFGQDAIKGLIEKIKSNSYERVLIVTNHENAQNGNSVKISSILAKSRIVYQVFDKINTSANFNDVKSIMEMYNNFRADVIVALGSYSVMDACKAACVILANPEIKDARKIEGITCSKNPAKPLFVVSTGPGNARDFTYVCVNEDETHRRKIVSFDPNALPQVVICDSDIYASYPSKQFGLSGLAIMAAAIEGFVSKNSSQMTDFYNLKAIELIFENLKDAVKGKAKAKEQILYAQYLAGIGSSNSGRGLVAAMADSIEATNSVSPVLASVLLLPKIMEFIAASTGTKYREIALALGAKVSSTAKPDVYRKSALTALAKFYKEFDVPKNLGIDIPSKDDFAFLCDSVLKDTFASATPKAATAKKITDLYKSIL